MTPTPNKKTVARKSLCLFTTILYVKKKTDIHQVRAAKSKRKAIKAGNTPWALKPKQKVNSIMKDYIKKSFIIGLIIIHKFYNHQLSMIV